MNTNNSSSEGMFGFPSNSINRSNTQSNTLEVYISGTPCGVLSEDKHGAISFTSLKQKENHAKMSLNQKNGLSRALIEFREDYIGVYGNAGAEASIMVSFV